MKWWAFLLALAVGAAHAQALPDPVDEAEDFGVPPSAALRLENHASPTPREIPGAKLIGTAELQRRLRAEPEARPILFDVIGGGGHPTLPGAIWLPGAGRGESFDDAVQAQLARLLELTTRGDRARTVVFFCAGPKCWFSYNAALRAARLGYSEVYWYRGGIAAWRAAGGATATPRLRWKTPDG